MCVSLPLPSKGGSDLANLLELHCVALGIIEYCSIEADQQEMSLLVQLPSAGLSALRWFSMENA